MLNIDFGIFFYAHYTPIFGESNHLYWMFKSIVQIEAIIRNEFEEKRKKDKQKMVVFLWYTDVKIQKMIQ